MFIQTIMAIPQIVVDDARPKVVDELKDVNREDVSYL